MTASEKMLRDLYAVHGRRPFRTSDVIKWGVDNFSNRADRNARQLCEDELIYRIGRVTAKSVYGIDTKESLYKITDAGIAIVSEKQECIF
jgi:hypothetical protein